MVYFINDIMTGALIGLLYALVAMGFVVIYAPARCSISRRANW